MYRFSDGLMFTGSTEKAISYLVFQSGILKEKKFKSSLWTYLEKNRRELGYIKVTCMED